RMRRFSRTLPTGPTHRASRRGAAAPDLLKAGQKAPLPNRISPMTRSAVLLFVACLGASSVVLGGCKPAAGGACKVKTKEVCVDAKSALACHEGKWEAMKCRGPSGCSNAGDESICDQSVAEDKDVCNVANDFVCSSD